MPKFATLFHPTEAPYRGLASKPNITTLPAGVYSVAQNLRFDEGLPRVRFPFVRASPTAITGPYIGAWNGYLNGVYYQVTASNQSGQVYSVAVSDGAHTEITGSTGIKYLNTRLDSLFTCVSFAPVKDSRSGTEYLVIQDGKGYARVWNPTSSVTGEKVAIHAPITPPSILPAFNVVPTFPKSFPIYNSANTNAPTNSGANFVVNDSGASATINYLDVDIATGSTAGDTAQFNMTAAVDFSACPQLILYIDSAYQGWINHVQVELVDATGNTVVWNPAASATTIRKPFSVSIDTTGTKRLIVYDINHVATGNRDLVTGLKFTWRGSAPATAQQVNLNGVFGSGKIQGQTSYCVTYFNQGSRGESAGIHYDSINIAPEYLKNLGCRQDQDTVLPNDYRVFYQNNIPYTNPTQAQLEAGVDAINIYRSDPGEDYQKTFVVTEQIGSYGGGVWSLDSGTYGSILTYSDNADISTKNQFSYAPDADALSIPKGIWMESAGDRLFVLSYESSGGYNTPSYSALWASEVNNFGRFYKFHKSEESGTRVAFQGETATCLKSMPTSAYGVASMLLWTNVGLYRFSPTQATLINKLERVAPYGTWCPYSVASSDDSIYWVDQARICRRYDGARVEDLTSYSIQDKLDAVGGNSWTANGVGNNRLFFGCFWNQRYYLSCDQSGTVSWSTGTENPLVYETRRNTSGQEYGWSEDVIDSTYSTRFMIVADAYAYIFSKDGYRYRWEFPTSAAKKDGYREDPGTGGVAYSATLKTGCIYPGLRGEANGLVIDHSHIMNDDVTSGTATYTYNYLPSGAAPTQTASLDGSYSVTWQTTSTPPTSSTEGVGNAVSLQVVFSATAGVAGMRLYGWRAEYQDREYRPTSN